MSSMNVVVLTGRLGADPEAIGEAGQKFRLATNRRKKEGDVWIDVTDWHQCTVWGKKADTVARFFKKGSLVTVRGEINYREYDGKWYTDIVVFDCSLPPKSDAGASEASSVGTREKAPWE